MAHHYWPNAKIVAVEPHPQSVELMTKNTSHIPDSQLRRINAGDFVKAWKVLAIVPGLEQSGRRLCSRRLGIARAAVPRFRHRGPITDRRAILDAGNGLRDRRSRLDQARLRGSRVPDRFGALCLRTDGRDRLDPWRMAQPQGQFASGQSSEPNARLQHRSELPPLGGDVCGASSLDFEALQNR